ncbi:hypothetical protein HMPREF1579_01282 [Gardnerella vaginalis JCP8066]|uniref:Uncharacterized protein n=1 Tax=Gardnerella pickettii JCP7719 TaxID=1261061 RepID=S4I5S2_9BIFI|nr:hypothetical protein HMPREF1586_01341 [Gardnerella vaginalis JCP8522]EPI49702.1 hypothetical protein HMPREF1576_01390 [Gardnerella pickettii JCP7719]EPI58371.1 hypothetical protein HMPREF1579_01282 [Gardnerella vaginalis JCP8066]
MVQSREKLTGFVVLHADYSNKVGKHIAQINDFNACAIMLKI